MAKGDPKLTAEQHRKLVEKYNIHFDGPIPASSWPAQYVQVFQSIRDIARVRYEEYKPSERRAMITVAEMKDRVAKLNRIAYSCRRLRENEATWRGLTEPEIVSRFAGEVACPICDERLWDSEFKALPDDPIRARKLQKMRAERTLCRCRLEARAMEDIDQRGGAQLFLSRLQTRFVHDPVDPLTKEGLGAKAPDRVFGLRDTKAFKIASSAYEGLRQSPFSDGKVLYPFLIIEAKAEKASPGFESIENQTAFPIRTLLKLQNDLNSVSERSIRPLIWFLANQGDEWRVYGGTFDDSKWRVIDLWHGTILSRDETLQLLLIVDYICDWARDVYRRDIVDCLKAKVADIRDVTPAYSNFSLQREELNDDPPLPSGLTPRAMSAYTTSLVDLTLDSENDDIDMEDINPPRQEEEEEEEASLGSINSDEEEGESLTSTDRVDQHPLLRFSFSHSCSKPWNQHATILHSNMVLFSFRHIAVPDGAEALGAWLEPFKGPKGRPQVSQIPLLLRIIESYKAVTITMNGILQLENVWTRTNHQSSSKNDDPILAWIWFNSYVRPEDWQVVRELRCFTVSKPAIINLRRITGIIPFQGQTDWTVHRCHCLISDAQSLRSLCGKDSMISAITSLSLRLDPIMHTNDVVHFGWVNCFSTEADEANVAQSDLWRSAVQYPATYHSRDLLEELLPGKVVPPSLIPHLRMRAGFGAKGAILLKKSFWQSASCPTYCLMVLDETDFEDERSLGQKIIQVARIGDYYVGRLTGGFESVVSPGESDKSAINLWTNILCGKVAEDAEWPLVSL